MLFVSDLEWQEHKKLLGKRDYHISLGAHQADMIAQVLKGRIPHGKSLLLKGDEHLVKFVPGKQTTAKVADGILQVFLEQSDYGFLLNQLIPKAGTFHLPGAPYIQIQIVKSYIKNQQGEVVEEVG
ncbi:hypothetical protein C8P63_12337 [Melghirimyces profundicolus]|uniref:Uncharacterized protein n=1 Tax=Melghirimyces profundicolus TaxID=1242148 RepID=A0A2T6BG22_9BACL|nr:hypothetical protein [Melghirimyces profundicolus]PTX55015.1 hypothetical protein C8P63_12337 [Melghirimyces profundicolus]